MSVLIDTNVLLRRAQPFHPYHDAAVESIARRLSDNIPVYFTPQNISEFWNVATRLTRTASGYRMKQWSRNWQLSRLS